MKIKGITATIHDTKGGDPKYYFVSTESEKEAEAMMAELGYARDAYDFSPNGALSIECDTPE